MVSSRRKRLEREIDRDARVTTSGYVHEVMALTIGQLQHVSLANRCPDPIDLFDQVDAITRKFRNFHRRLNDARINRRGERDSQTPEPSELPADVRDFAYHGAYVGAFASVEEFAHACLDPARPDLWATYVDLTQAGIDLHLSGRYWTVDAEGVTHAFAVVDAGPGGPDTDEPQGAGDGARSGELRFDATTMPTLPVLSRLGPPAPPPPRHEPERARAALAQAGCDEREIDELMAHYVAGYASLGDHVYYFLRHGGLARAVLGHTDLAGIAGEWCVAGALAWVSDPAGGVQVFGFGDPLASER